MKYLCLAANLNYLQWELVKKTVGQFGWNRSGHLHVNEPLRNVASTHVRDVAANAGDN